MNYKKKVLKGNNEIKCKAYNYTIFSFCRLLDKKKLLDFKETSIET